MNPALALGAAWGIALAVPIAARARVGGTRARTVALAGPRRRPGRFGRRDARRVSLHGIGHGGRVRRVLIGAWARVRDRDRARLVERGVPLALDVLTMAARAGYTPRLAVDAAARWSPDDVARALAAVEQRCRLGAAFADALDHVGREQPALRGLTDGLAVAERSGAPIADLLARLADDARSTLRRRAETHARRVPVRLLFPLVFLVLPAFGLLTVVPALAAGLRNT